MQIIDELNKYKNDLKSEVDVLEKKKSELLNETGRLSNELEDLKQIKASFPDVVAERDSVLVEVGNLHNTYKQAQELIKQLGEKKSTVSGEVVREEDNLKKLLDEIIVKEQVLGKLESDISLLDKDKTSLTEHYQSLKEQIKNSELLLSQLNNSINDIKTQIKSTTNDLVQVTTNLDNEKLELARVISEIKGKEQETENVRREIISKNKELQEKTNEIKGLEDKKKEMLKEREELNNQKLEFEKVQGDLSQREVWLDEKRQSLIEVKAGLEAHIGKKLDSIII